MASLPRIMVVDHQNDVGRIVRATLDLLNYPAIIVEVPTDKEALLELQSVPFSVLVTSYGLPNMNGFDLAKRATMDIPDIKVIVLANANDDLPEEEVPFSLLVRPFAAERFSKALRIALGEEVEDETSAAVSLLPDIGPVPEVELPELNSILSAVLTDVGAMAALLMDRTGEILLEQGAVGYLNRDQLANIVAPQFAAMSQIGEIVGGKEPWAMYRWDGKEYDVYGLSAGLHHFVLLVFPGTGASRALAAVSKWGRDAVEDMVKVMGELAFKVAKPPKPKKSKTKPSAAPSAPIPDLDLEPVTATPEAEPVLDLPPRPRREPAPPPPTVEVNEGTLKEALTKMETVDIDNFWESLDDDEQPLSDALVDEDALSFEEALQLGLLPPDLSGQS